MVDLASVGHKDPAFNRLVESNRLSGLSHLLMDASAALLDDLRLRLWHVLIDRLHHHDGLVAYLGRQRLDIVWVTSHLLLTSLVLGDLVVDETWLATWCRSCSHC